MSGKNKKQKIDNVSKNSEVTGLEITVLSLLKNGYTENDDIIIQLRKMIKEKN